MLGIDKRTVLSWNSTTLNGCPLFTADVRTHDNTFLYEIERVEQLASVYHPKWKRSGYEPSPTTADFQPISHPAPVENNQQTTIKKPFQKISASTLEAISHLSPDELEAHGIIQPARVSGYICPLCGTGEGSHGTGMALNKKIETHTSFTCFGGKHSFNVIKLCALHYNLDTRNDFQQLVEKICADFDIPLEYEAFSLTSGRRSTKKISGRKEQISPEELKNIQEDLNSSIEPLKTFMLYHLTKNGVALILSFLPITVAV